jgi:hypothetical protein
MLSLTLAIILTIIFLVNLAKLFLGK